MCTNVQPEFGLRIMFDYDSIRFGKNMTSTFMAPINIHVPCLLDAACAFRLLNFVFYVLSFGF